LSSTMQRAAAEAGTVDIFANAQHA